MATFTKNHIEKNIGFWLVCSNPSTILSRSYTKKFPFFSFSTKCSEWQKFSQEDQVKMLVENFLYLKPVEFYLRGINKLPRRWFKIIPNILLTKINSLLNSSWINYILLEQKLFMTQPNIYIYIYIYTHTHTHTHIYIYTHMRKHTHTHIF